MHDSLRLRAVQSPIIPVVADLIRAHPGTISLGQGVVHYGPPPAALEQIARFLAEPANHKYQPVAGIPALVAALGPRNPDLRRIVRVHVGLTHKDDEVLAAADAFVRILVDVIPRPEASPRTAAEAAAALRESILQHGRDWISAAKLRSWEGLSDRQLVGGTLSSACYIEEAFPAALALAWRHAGNLAEGVCANAMCGGDNCHRGAVVGGLLGATAPIPALFLAGLACGARVMES
jgi:hypothetical protein